jgi:hypothetical protein
LRTRAFCAGYICPEWAGGQGSSVVLNTTGDGWPHDYRGKHTGFDSHWTMLDFVKHSDTQIAVDLSPLNGATPTAVRYAWGASTLHAILCSAARLNRSQI